MLAIFRLGLGWWKTFLMQCVGPWIKGSLIQNGSRRWVGRWAATPHCARWKCGPISLRVALMNLDPPTKGMVSPAPKTKSISMDAWKNSSPSILADARNRGRKSTVRRLSYDETRGQPDLLLR